jgi:hypothetical protein
MRRQPKLNAKFARTLVRLCLEPPPQRHLVLPQLLVGRLKHRLKGGRRFRLGRRQSEWISRYCS